jgi:hypothetical protein
MLIKYHDRLTIDGFLAVRAALRGGGDSALKELLKSVSGAERREGQLPFSADVAEAVRFQDGDLRSLEAADSSLCSTVADLESDPEEFRRFLLSDAGDRLAFWGGPIIQAFFPRSTDGARRLHVFEGCTGRKYARSQKEVVEFLERHPGKDGLLSDISMQFFLESPLRGLEELERFLEKDPEEKLDAVIEVAGLQKGYLFGAESFGAEIAARCDWFFQLDSRSRATLEFVLDSAESYRPIPVSFAAAEKALAESLTGIVSFATGAGVFDDAASFVAGLRILEHGAPDDRSGRFWSLCGLSEERRRLLGAALRSDNFAGMCSWNDVQIEKDESFRRATNQVVFCIVQAICGAAAP